MSTLFQETPFMATLLSESSVFSILRFSALSIVALLILVFHGTVFQRVADTLHSKLSPQESSQTPETKKSLKSNKPADNKATASLFPPIVIGETLSATNKRQQSCATHNTFNYVPIQANNVVVGFDMNLEELPFLYDHDKMGNAIPLEASPISFTSTSNSASSSPMSDNISMTSSGFYNGMNYDVLAQQQMLQYPQQQQLPVVDYSKPMERERQLSHGNESVITACTPPELDGFTPQHAYSSPEDSQIMGAFPEQPMMFPQDTMQFLAGEGQVDNAAIFGDAIAIQPQMIPNGLYPVVHSRSNSNNVDDYVLELEKTGLLNSVNLMNQVNVESILPDSFLLPQEHLPHQHQVEHRSSHEMMPYNMPPHFIPPNQVPVGPGFLSPVSDFTSPMEHMSSSSDNGDSNSKVKHPFSCPHCPSSFRIRGYLTRHMKKHAMKKAYLCPFYDPSDKTPCHPSGGFSRRDTYKTHLKARHFMYPAGTRSENRGKVSGMCSGCGLKFDSNEKWVEEHIHNRQCPGLLEH